MPAQDAAESTTKDALVVVEPQVEALLEPLPNPQEAEDGNQLEEEDNRDMEVFGLF